MNLLSFDYSLRIWGRSAFIVNLQLDRTLDGLWENFWGIKVYIRYDFSFSNIIIIMLKIVDVTGVSYTLSLAPLRVMEKGYGHHVMVPHSTE